MKAKSWLVGVTFAAVILVASPGSAMAGPFRHLWRAKPATPRYQGHYKSSHYDRVRELNHYYPKYYGGFHSRHFDTLGIPTGDIGLRGNGIYMMPW